MRISVASEHICHLGEGPVWDADDELLYWVDSFAPRLYRYDFHTKQTDYFDLPGKTIGSLAPRVSGGLVLAMDQGFY
ncbi:MAG: SMP-30/gluconolactonase/LRE family protein, partial [Pseudomonadota bacterium]